MEYLSAPPALLVEVPAVAGLHVLCTQAADEAMLLALRGELQPERVETQLEQYLTHIKTAIKSESSTAHYSSMKQWRTWVQQQNSGALGWAHRWTKQSTDRQSYKHTKAGWQGKPLEMLECECSRLRELWDSSDVPLPPWPTQAWDLPRIDPERLQEVSRSFKKLTSQTYDGFHPVHYSMLSMDHIAILARFLESIERVGVFPSAMQVCLSTLIPKHKKDALQQSTPFRGIGMLTSLYRVWGKVRQDEVRSWETRNPSVQIGHQRGRSILETVYLQSATMEVAVSEGSNKLVGGAIMWDLSNYYEFVSREALWERAVSVKFPLTLLTLIFSQYQSKRLVTLDSMVVEGGYPRSGLCAGCCFATFLVQVYTIEALRQFQSKHIETPLTMFIDDLLLMCVARTEELFLSRLVEAAAALAVMIEFDLHCKIALHKSAVVASTPELQKKLHQTLGIYGGKLVEGAAANLGIDFFCGQSRLKKTASRLLQQRSQKLKKRVGKIMSVKEAGLNTLKLWTTGLQSYGFHGADIMGLTDKELFDAQTLMLRVVASKSPTMSRTMSLLLVEDPTYKLGMGPLLQWHSIVWKSATQQGHNLPSMPALRAMAATILEKAPRPWKQVKGPWGSISMSLFRIQWRWVSPFEFATRAGHVVNLITTSPRLLQKWVRKDWLKTLSTYAAERMGIPGSDVHMLTGKRLLRFADLSALEKRLLEAYLCQTIWTPWRLHMAGYECNLTCEKCGQGIGTLHHRVFQRTYEPVAKLREEFLQEFMDVFTDTSQNFPLLMGVEVRPHFDIGAPEGFGESSFDFWSQEGL